MRTRVTTALVVVAVGALAAAVCLAQPPQPAPTANEGGKTMASGWRMVRTKFKPSDAEWTERATRTVDQLTDFKPADPPVRLSKYGGWLDHQRDATGFFRVEKVGDRWWMVDPEGCLYLHVAVVGVGPMRTPGAKAAFESKFGTPAAWADATTDMLRGLGFSGSGAWSDDALVRGAEHPLVYTPIWNFMSTFAGNKGLTRTQPGHKGYPNDCILVFHPEFAQFCDDYARKLEATKDNPWLLGHFSDNEMPAPKDMLERFLALDAAHPDLAPNRTEAQRWLDARKGRPAGTADITEEDRTEFMAYVFGRYLEITTAAIRKHDPNHMCLGPRFYSNEKQVPAVWREAGKHLDAIGVNWYFAWDPSQKQLADWTAWSGRPVIITEWYAKGMDAGLPNTSGAGWTVPAQADRGAFYQCFTLGLLQSRTCVGWHWFKYGDNDPLDPKAEPSNVDSNKGMVTITFEPYAPLTEAMKALNTHVYGLTEYFDRP